MKTSPCLMNFNLKNKLGCYLECTGMEKLFFSVICRKVVEIEIMVRHVLFLQYQRFFQPLVLLSWSTRERSCTRYIFTHLPP